MTSARIGPRLVASSYGQFEKGRHKPGLAGSPAMAEPLCPVGAAYAGSLLDRRATLSHENGCKNELLP